MTKTYQNLVTPIYSTHLMVDGTRVDIRFATGAKEHPKRINGKFRTSDPKLMEALDNSPLYGKNWVCISTTEPQEKMEGKKEEENLEPEVKQIHGPKTAKAMREYLNKKLGVPWSKLPNKDAALRVANEMNLEFVNVN